MTDEEEADHHHQDVIGNILFYSSNRKCYESNSFSIQFIRRYSRSPRRDRRRDRYSRSRSKDRQFDRNDLKDKNIKTSDKPPAKKQATSVHTGKKLPFIGRMPVFKKQTTGMCQRFFFKAK